LERTIRELADAAIPVLWVTDDLEQVLCIADRLIVLDTGVS
jgi:ABC-type sugar transport system ATPase subunit